MSSYQNNRTVGVPRSQLVKQAFDAVKRVGGGRKIDARRVMKYPVEATQNPHDFLVKNGNSQIGGSDDYITRGKSTYPYTSSSSDSAKRFIASRNMGNEGYSNTGVGAIRHSGRAGQDYSTSSFDMPASRHYGKAGSDYSTSGTDSNKRFVSYASQEKYGQPNIGQPRFTAIKGKGYTY
jgi:hypothetical protein